MRPDLNPHLTVVAGALFVVGTAVTPLSAIAAEPRTLHFSGACKTGAETTIAVAGDLLFHRRLQRQAYASPIGARSLFSPEMRKLIAAADVAYANFEGPAAHGIAGFGRRVRDPGRRMDGIVYNGYPAFNFHPSMIGGLRDVGFDIVSTANNHSLDRGAIGARRTIANMHRHAMPFTGTRASRLTAGPPAYGDWSRLIRHRGFTTAWLACAEMTNGLPDRKRQVLMCHRDRSAVMRELARLHANPAIDAVFLTPHWGEENQTRPRRRHRAYARAAIEAGATAVIGTHPHVVQPWEKIVTESGREGMAIYSTGNFISGQVRPMQRGGVLGLLRLVRPKGEKVVLRSVGYIPSWVSFARGRRIVHPAARLPESRSVVRQMNRILPVGNLVAAQHPFRLPQTCPHLSAEAQRLAALSNGRHPVVPGPRVAGRTDEGGFRDDAVRPRAAPQRPRRVAARASRRRSQGHPNPFNANR
ncbi:MAG: CapA family protein [Pseudomonadota bacterium]